MSGNPESDYQNALKRARERSATLAGPSLLERLARLPTKKREDALAQLSAIDRVQLADHWPAWARPKQDPPIGDKHRILMWLSGRGFGKSRSAAERVRRRIYQGARALAIIGPKQNDVERFMLGTEGEPSGLLNVFHPAHRPVYRGPPKSIVSFHTGAVGYVVSAETPEFRGANLDTVWCDELAQWRFLETLWANMEMALRTVSSVPLEIIVTTTPRPLRFLKELVADEDCVTIIGESGENISNVDPRWLDRMQRKHGGTRLGRQELEGEILGDNPDAYFYSSVLDAHRREIEPAFLRKAVSVDPAIATDRKNDETGIVVGGIDDTDGHEYVIADLSGRHKPEVWGKLVVEAYIANGCEAVVGERNRGGDLVESNVRAAMERKQGTVAAQALKFVNVLATKGKAIRAEPVSSLHMKGMIHMVGRHVVLEDEITEWNPKLGGPSPNRLDALVWLTWYLGKLGEEDRPDMRAGFRGIEQAQKALSPQRAEGLPLAFGPQSRDSWGRL